MKGKSIVPILVASAFFTGCLGPTMFAVRSVVNYENQEASMDGRIRNEPKNKSSVEADKQYETAASVNTSSGTATTTQRPDKNLERDEEPSKSSEKQSEESGKSADAKKPETAENASKTDSSGK